MACLGHIYIVHQEHTLQPTDIVCAIKQSVHCVLRLKLLNYSKACTLAHCYVATSLVITIVTVMRCSYAYVTSLPCLKLQPKLYINTTKFNFHELHHAAKIHNQLKLQNFKCWLHWQQWFIILQNASNCTVFFCTSAWKQSNLHLTDIMSAHTSYCMQKHLPRALW